MAAPLKLRFLLSAAKLEQLPDSRAEVTVVGRSNVGKSSLLNALGGSSKLAHTSKTPGRTQLLNCFELERDATFVDCPGYGYAKTSKSTRESWAEMIETYLLEREQLVMILTLVDGEIGPTKLDIQMLDWLRSHGLPHTVVATKYDKVRSSGRDKRKKELAAGCQLDPSDIVWASAAKSVGIDRLQGMIRLWLDLA